MTRDDLKVTVVRGGPRPDPPPRWPEVAVWILEPGDPSAPKWVEAPDRYLSAMTDTRRPKTPYFYLHSNASPDLPEEVLVGQMEDAMWRSYNRAHPEGCP